MITDTISTLAKRYDLNLNVVSSINRDEILQKLIAKEISLEDINKLNREKKLSISDWHFLYCQMVLKYPIERKYNNVLHHNQCKPKPRREKELTKQFRSGELTWNSLLDMNERGSVAVESVYYVLNHCFFGVYYKNIKQALVVIGTPRKSDKFVYEEPSFYEEQEEIDVKEISHLYELRHACNVLGQQYVADELKIPVNKIQSICQSQIHGSIDIEEFLGCKDDSEFKKFVNKHKQIEKERIRTLEQAEYKNMCLVQSLHTNRTAFAGLGTNKAKRRLNKISASNDVAKAVRIALEIEDKNIIAKDTYGKYRDKVYNKKQELILELSKLFKSHNWVYGVQESTVIGVTHIIYFEIPRCEQISWHFSAGNNSFPKYDKNWDGKENSTLRKLEKVSLELLKENGLDK